MKSKQKNFQESQAATVRKKTRDQHDFFRRDFLKKLALAGVGVMLPGKLFQVAPGLARADENKKNANSSEEANNQKQASPLTKKIPSSGVVLPAIGMGTWVTFNVGEDQKLRNARTQVLKKFFKKGGGVIDSSPMYGSSEAVIGYGLEKLNDPSALFSATKVWTDSEKKGLEQIKNSKKLWGVEQFDLLQVHNLIGWEKHLENLFVMKEKGELKHVGVTTSHGRRHDELEKVMKTQPLDFVQLTYNIVDREVEKRLLPLAAERGIAVIANRPFRGGSLVKGLQRKEKPLPKVASKIQCSNWPEFLLKFIISHPAITCAIPATTQVEHMQENKNAALGPMPDEATRKEMIQAMDI